MKNLFSLLVAVLLTVCAFSQAPEKLSYQAVVRNADGELIKNSPVGLKINILQTTKEGKVVYEEAQTTTTNSNGMVTIEIGGGTGFNTIDWANGPYFIKTETDPAGGTDYTIAGTSQLLSVPYALYAENAESYNLQEVIDKGNSADVDLDDNKKNAVFISASGGNKPDTWYNGINSTITGTNGYLTAIYGRANGNSLQRNYGLYGVATNAAELNTGVLGYAYGSKKDNYGIWGIGEDAVDGWDNRGVMGYAIGTTSTGWNYGVTGWVGNSEYSNIAVGAYADNGKTTNSNNYAVSARATIETSTGTNYGIFSTASNGAVNYAGFFNGDVTITGTLSQPSDKNLKDNIHSVSSAMEKIILLKPVSYFYNHSKKNSLLQLPGNLQYGFVAQDMELVFPELVTNQVIDMHSAGSGGRDIGEQEILTENNKLEFKGINYTGLISILTQGIKEQQEQIRLLEDKNSELERRISTLEDLILLK